MSTPNKNYTMKHLPEIFWEHSRETLELMKVWLKRYLQRSRVRTLTPCSSPKWSGRIAKEVLKTADKEQRIE